MAKTVVRDGLGVRIRDYADRRGWSVAELARRLGMSRFVLYAALKKPGWPPMAPEFYSKASELLDCTIADLLPDEVAKKLAAPPGRKGETTMENRMPSDAGNVRRYGQPITKESIALQALGRIEHYLARLDEVEELHQRRVSDLMREFRTEISDTRHDLLRHIEHTDKGKKV